MDTVTALSLTADHVVVSAWSLTAEHVVVSAWSLTADHVVVSGWSLTMRSQGLFGDNDDCVAIDCKFGQSFTDLK